MRNVRYMRKLGIGLLCLTLAFGATACGKQNNKIERAVFTSSDTATQGEETEAGEQGEDGAKKTPNNTKPVDVSGAEKEAVLAEISAMQLTPEEYEGRMVRVKGKYHFNEVGEDRYDLVNFDDDNEGLVSLEFILPESYKYPDDYPKEGEEIVVEGVFDKIESYGISYYAITNAKLIK